MERRRAEFHSEPVLHRSAPVLTQRVRGGKVPSSCQWQPARTCSSHPRPPPWCRFLKPLPAKYEEQLAKLRQQEAAIQERHLQFKRNEVSSMSGKGGSGESRAAGRAQLCRCIRLHLDCSISFVLFACSLPVASAARYEQEHVTPTAIAKSFLNLAAVAAIVSGSNRGAR